MERYMLLDGIDTRTYGVRVMNLPPVQVPMKRAQLVQVPGRSGFLTNWDGDYEALTKMVGLFYAGNDPDDVARRLQGATRATFSNEPDKEYRVYPQTSEIPLTRMLSTWHRFDYELLCDPLKRELAPARVTVTAPPVVLVNPGNHPACPTIEITGTGDVDLIVGDQEIALTDIGPAITIDGELLDCYQGGVGANNKMTGGFPEIRPGEPVQITWTGSVTQVTVKPNWRWV